MTYDITINGLIGAENRIKPAVLCDGEQIRVIIENCPDGAVLFADNERAHKSVRVFDGIAILPAEFSKSSRLLLTIGVFEDGACVHEIPLPPILVVKADGATYLRDWITETEKRIEDLEAATFGHALSFDDQI